MARTRVPGARTLWVVAAVLAAVFTGIALIPRQSPHDRVATYIDRVNATGQTFSKQYRDVTKAYTVSGAKPETRAARLDRAARRLSELRGEIAAVPAPKEARVLRARLIELYRAEESVGYEIAAITRYFPRVVAAERPLAPAAKAMRETISESPSPAAQAAALQAYADTLAATEARLARIPAPDVLRTAKGAERARLARVEKSVRAVGKALAANDRKGLAKAVKGLGAPNTAAATAMRAGVIAYNRHVRSIERLAAAVERERRRLVLVVS